jgi:hypothetical protein
MKLLKSIWAEKVIKGTFKGSLQEFALNNLQENKIYNGASHITSLLELLALDPNKLFLEEIPKTSKKASLKKKADVIFSPGTDVLECPHCKLPMKKTNLANGLGALICSNCKHVDYDDNVKSTINAGSPSVDKSLQFKYTNSGNCQIV